MILVVERVTDKLYFMNIKAFFYSSKYFSNFVNYGNDIVWTQNTAN